MRGKTDDVSTKSKRRLSLDFLQTKSNKRSVQKRQSLSTTLSDKGTSSKTKLSKQKGEKLSFLTESRPRILRTQSSYVIDTVREATDDDVTDSSFSSDFDMSDVSFTSVFSHCPTPPPRRLSEISMNSYDHSIESSKLRRNLFTPVRKTAHRINPITSSFGDVKGLRHVGDSDKTPTQSSVNRIFGVNKESSSDHFGKKQRRDSDIGLNTSTSSPRKRRSDYFYSLPGLKNIRMTSPKTLRDFLKKKSRLVAFRNFLKKEFSEENLDFWVEVEAYRKQRQAKQTKLAPIICETYIEVGAPREVNIDAVTRKTTMGNSLRPDNVTFDLAQECVYTLMETDSFQRFLLKEWNTSVEDKLNPCPKNPAKSHRKSICVEEKKRKSKSDSFLHPNITERRRKGSSQL